MELPKVIRQLEGHDQDAEAQDDHMLRLPQIEPTNPDHQHVTHNQVEHPP